MLARFLSKPGVLSPRTSTGRVRPTPYTRTPGHTRMLGEMRYRPEGRNTTAPGLCSVAWSMACWIASESSARPSALPFTLTARESAGADSMADVEARAVDATIVAAMVDRKRVCIISFGSLLVVGLL